jgi:Domain of unknown function (DUF4157)
MKPSIYRRIRRRSASHEATNANKESKQEQSFFGEASHETFFQPTAAIQRKCEKCEEEEKVQRQPEKKEEEKKLMRVEDKKEEDKKLQKKEEEKKEEEKLQKKDAGPSSTSSSGINNYVSSINGKGNPIPANVNHFFSSKMGYDFSNVKVHTDKEAAKSAKDVNAKAYTIGNHIVFNEGQYNHESSEGKKLMAHELTHFMQNNEATGESIKRAEENAVPQPEEEILPGVSFSGEGTSINNPTHYANCNGVRVRGSTTANYTSNFSSDGNQVRARDCRGCAASECITSTGTVLSDFSANPSVSLPSPPSGLSECETTAVQNFIDTTLSAHEQQHVDAFNTYIGTVTTPYTFTGCVVGLEPHIRAIHHRIDTARRAAANALSAALDANGANIFTVTCNCPDPVPDAGAKK